MRPGSLTAGMAATAGEAATAEAVGVATAAEAVGVATAAEAAAEAVAAAAAADDGAVGGSLVLGPWWGDRTGKGQADPPPPNRRQRRTLTRCGTARAGGARGDPRAAHRRPLSLSWSRWYQAIVLADQGYEQGAPREELRGPREDAGLNELEHVEVGRRRYQLLRRFMDQYSEWFREPTLIRTVAQALQSKLAL